MSTVSEIESAIEQLAPAEKREVLNYLSAALESEEEPADFPDLKALLLDFPNVGTDDDFARVREMPRDLDLS